MAPEVIMQGKCTLKADIYSLGVVFWELATQVRSEAPETSKLTVHPSVSCLPPE